MRPRCLTVCVFTIIAVLQVLLRSNRIDALLSRLLPHGQLLFLNHRFAQSLEKDVAAYMAKWLSGTLLCVEGWLPPPRSSPTPPASKHSRPLLFAFGDFAAAAEEEGTAGICCFRLHGLVNTRSGKYLPQPLAARCWLLTVWEASVQILFVKLKSGKENVADLRARLRRPFKSHLSASKAVIYLICHTWNATAWPWAAGLHLCFDNFWNINVSQVYYSGPSWTRCCLCLHVQ